MNPDTAPLQMKYTSGARSKFFFGGCQGWRTGMGVTTVSDSLILGEWVTTIF